jgi:serine/threonine-protein kinase RsbW
MDTLMGTCVRTFTGSPASVSQARAWVASFLPGSPVADDAALLTSELFTNAILYSASRLPGGVVLVSVRTGRTWIRVDVIDQGEVPPRIAAPPGLGQGLEIIRQLADAFGDEDGSRWFSLTTARGWAEGQRRPDLAELSRATAATSISAQVPDFGACGHRDYEQISEQEGQPS